MRSENSGLIDLDALLKEASQPELPRSTDLPLEPSRPPPPSSSTAVVLSPVSVPAPVSVRVSRVPGQSLPERRRSRLVPFAALAAIAAISAFTLLSLRAHDRETAVPTPRASARATANAAHDLPTPPPSTPAGISLDDLPAAAVAAPPSPFPSPPPAPTAPLPVAHGPTSSSASLVALGDAPSAAKGDLGGAMREAVGPRSVADVAVGEAATSGSARQLRPSPGAVVGAINSVLPAARACLGEDDAARGATIVFKSDGTVARVELAAPAEPPTSASDARCPRRARGRSSKTRSRRARPSVPDRRSTST